MSDVAVEWREENGKEGEKNLIEHVANVLKVTQIPRGSDHTMVINLEEKTKP